MILVADLYQTLLDLTRSDKRGESLSVEEFNRVLRVVNEEVFDDYVEGFESGIGNADAMGGFKIINYSIPIALSDGSLVGTLPDNYYQLIGKPRLASGRRCDLVTEYEYAVREEDYLTQATLTYPLCRIGGLNTAFELQIRVNPTTIVGNLYVDYLRTVNVPYLDYYVNDTTLTKTFLSESALAQSIPSGSTYRDGTAGGALVTKISQTVNLEWCDEDLNLLLAKMMKKMGVALPDESLAQSGMADELKSEE
jgi:hypothetical protein